MYLINKKLAKIHNNAKSDKDKWSIINDTRNSKRSTSNIFCLKNSFDEYITDPLKIANFLKGTKWTSRLQIAARLILNENANPKHSTNVYITQAKLKGQ